MSARWIALGLGMTPQLEGQLRVVTIGNVHIRISDLSDLWCDDGSASQKCACKTV